MGYRTLQVTARPQPLYVGQPLRKDQGLGVGWTLANNDQTNPVFVSTNPGVKSTDSDAVQVAPLGSIPVDPTLTSYVISAGPSVQCYLMPGGGTWAPSPAQIAAQINALGLMKDTTGVNINTNVTGVAKDASITPLAKDASITPLAKDASVTPLAKDTTLAGQTTGATIATDVNNAGVPLVSKSTIIFNNVGATHTVAVGTPWTPFSQSAMTRPTYEIWVSLGVMAADAQPWARINLAWFDSTSNQQIAGQDYILAVGTTTPCTYHGIGPIHGNQLTVTITNLGAASSLGAIIQVFNNSNPALYELWRSEVTSAVNGAGNGFLPQLLTANYLANGVVNIATGANDARLLPFYVGLPAQFSITTASNTTDCEARLQMPTSMATALGLATNIVFADYNTDSKGLIQQVYSMPRFMMQCLAINHNAGAQNIVRAVAGSV